MTHAQAVVRALVSRANRPTVALMSGQHAKQKAFAGDRSRHVMALCSRQCGKTWGIAEAALERSLEAPMGNRAYLALKGTQARDIMWDPIWRPLLDRYGVKAQHNETRMVTRFRNGSKIIFGGTDDIENIKKQLGSGFDDIWIDECQDQPDRVLRPLVERILPPTLVARHGRITLTGTVPEVDAGLFIEIWKRQLSTWSRHNWSMFDNPFFPDPGAELRSHLAQHPGLAEEDPIIQREWFGRFVYDSKATAYGYSEALSAYDATEPPWLADVRATLVSGAISASEPHPGITMFSVGIDPGSDDRWALEVWGWGEGTPEVQHVFDWASDRKARLNWSDMVGIAAHVQRHYSPDLWFYDAGSSQVEIDTFTADYGIPVIKAAQKTDLRGQVRRFADLLARGIAKVMRGSPTEEDLKKARFDPDARAKGVWRWSSNWHPDPSEAARYGLQGYFSAYVPPTPELTPAEARAARIEKATQQFSPKEPDSEESWSSGEDEEGWGAEETW